MMNPAWPERMGFGQVGASSNNRRKTGFSEGRAQQGFWPGTENAQKSSERARSDQRLAAEWPQTLLTDGFKPAPRLRIEVDRARL
jgi:hypothetical protein